MKNNIKKHIFSKNLLIIALFLFTAFSWIFPKDTVAKDVLGMNYTVTDSQLVDKVNLIRRQNGLSPLYLNNKLSEAASQKANDMLQKNYWAHFSPTGTTPWYFINKNNYKYVYAGENLAKGYNNVDELFNAWINSESHKKNILSKHYVDTGFAMVSGKFQGEDSTIVVEMFASPN